MGVEGLFKGAIPVLERALDLRSIKHSLIVSNIANKDTPNYKPFGLMVEEELNKSMGQSNPTQLERTQRGHLSGREVHRVEGGVREEKTLRFSLRRDGNSVDIDREMAKLSENNLLYDALTQIVSRKFRVLKDVIKGGR